MTTIQDAELDAQADAEQVDPADVEIHTDRGLLTLRLVREIPELTQRAAMAAALARETEKLGDEARSRRDMAALVMIEPYQVAQRPYDAAMARIDAALEARKIDRKTANERRVKAKETLRKGMVGVEYKPVDVYKKTIGVSRGLFVRMLHRVPQQLPEIENPREVALAAREECVVYDAINLAARTIRDETGQILLNGDKKRGIKAMSNADFARLTGLTTARVAQIRYGVR